VLGHTTPAARPSGQPPEAADPDPRHESTAPAGPARLEAADQLGCQLVRLMRLIERTAAQTASRRADGIERAAYVLLAHLVREGAQRAGALAEAVHSDPSTVSRQVGTLVQHGLVERRSDPLDGRACLLAATEQGRRVFDEHRAERNENTARILATWSPSEVRLLTELLDRFNSDFEHFREQQDDASGELAR
jgi:DNA-binding MarR family transcriptional regulator